MEVKFETKEKFTVVTPNEAHLSANMTEELTTSCSQYLDQQPKNVVLNLQDVQSIDEDAASSITTLQQNFYEQNASFVVCGMSRELEQKFDELELLDFLNFTPTESEAWDIVQMEEIERELLDSDDVTFESD
jgi:anti-anti-sigma factor